MFRAKLRRRIFEVLTVVFLSMAIYIPGMALISNQGFQVVLFTTITVIVPYMTDLLVKKLDKQIKALSWSVDGKSITISDFSKYPVEVVKTLSHSNSPVFMSRLVLFNDGEGSVRKNDIATLNPLRFETKSSSYKTLYAYAVYSSDPEAVFKGKIVDDMPLIYVDFDYIAEGASTVFEVFHTDPLGDLIVRGGMIDQGSFLVNKVGICNAGLQKKEGRINDRDAKINYLRTFYTRVFFAYVIISSISLLLVSLTRNPSSSFLQLGYNTEPAINILLFISLVLLILSLVIFAFALSKALLNYFAKAEVERYKNRFAAFCKH